MILDLEAQELVDGPERLGAQVIFEEQDVALERPVDLGGRAEAVAEAVPGGVFFSRRTAPRAVVVALIAARMTK
jgi:hypothetical protein